MIKLKYFENFKNNKIYTNINHRIRALQYLKYDYYPAYIYGSHAKLLIEYIEKMN